MWGLGGWERLVWLRHGGYHDSLCRPRGTPAPRVKGNPCRYVTRKGMAIQTTRVQWIISVGPKQVLESLQRRLSKGQGRPGAVIAQSWLTRWPAWRRDGLGRRPTRRPTELLEFIAPGGLHVRSLWGPPARSCSWGPYPPHLD